MSDLQQPAADKPIRIFHPSDFSRESRVAFAHALKIALCAKADLEIMHVSQRAITEDKHAHWTDFPGVRPTLARWKILPANAKAEDVEKLGIHARKIVNIGMDPLETMLNYCADHHPDLMVLATHQREGLARWFHRPVAEPLARRSRALTLFVPHEGKGFVSPANGTVNLTKILIPVDHKPNAQKALEEVFFLASGLGCPAVSYRLLHIGTESGMPTLFLPHHPDYSWDKRLLNGDPVETILQEANDWRPDLIVFATQGHLDYLDAWRGSTSERVLRGVGCPVLAVPEES